VKTLLLDNGDLVLDAGDFRAVTGTPKIIQDITIALKEPIGCDRFHPQWGSILASYIGDPIDGAMQFQIKTEVQRVIDNFAIIQGSNMTQDIADGRAPRYSSGELINGVKSVQVRQDMDRFHVRIILSTLTVDEIVLVSTVGGS
jgi:phage baseplate assembly protein W